MADCQHLIGLLFKTNKIGGKVFIRFGNGYIAPGGILIQIFIVAYCVGIDMPRFIGIIFKWLKTRV